MKRYFIELAYSGKGFAGFQVQQNAVTIQSELEKALQVYYRKEFRLTGSSRTDAGVHAFQNFFHTDTEIPLNQAAVYNLNALLPPQIVVKSFRPVRSEAHCRFDAVSREYQYFIYDFKNPFIAETAYYFPYTLDIPRMKEAAALLRAYSNFESFSKRNTQVKTFECRLEESEWMKEGACWIYRVRANRFLRGMVRGLVGTMLQVGRGKLGMEEFRAVIEARDASGADFAVPGHGLFLMKVNYPENYFVGEG